MHFYNDQNATIHILKNNLDNYNLQKEKEKNNKIAFNCEVNLLVLELIKQIVLFKLAFDAKWTRNEKWSNLCSLGRHYYLIN